MEIEHDYLPLVVAKYKDKAAITIKYFNIAEKENFKLLLTLEAEFGNRIRTPAVLIGNHLLIGSETIKKKLEPLIDEYIVHPPIGAPPMKAIDLLQKFRSFSLWAIVAAGLIDGINPCAFTVIIFFISFLTLMGYKKTEVGLIGGAFIASVFATYLAIGCGLFRGLYELKQFYTFTKITYYIIAGLCFILAYLNVRDLIIYLRTKSTVAFAVKLPKPVRSRINAIIAAFYRKDPKGDSQSCLSLLLSALLVGFLVSLLEAVCTGQVYLPTIVFILKEPALRIRAIGYLLLYNFMFIAPLLLILCVAMVGTGSKMIEQFFKEKVAIIKLFMCVLFLGLGVVLLIGV